MIATWLLFAGLVFAGWVLLSVLVAWALYRAARALKGRARPPARRTS